MYESDNTPIKISSDHPIDDATYFNFSEYVQVITRIIRNTDNRTPFTIAINGEWGCGKTSLMKSIQQNLDSTIITDNNKSEVRKVKTVWFDAWKYSDKSSMLSALSLEIYENIVTNKVPLFGSKKKHRLKYLFFWISNLNKIKIAKQFISFSLSSLSLVNGVPPLNYDKFTVTDWVKFPTNKANISYYSRFNEFLDTIIELYFIDSKCKEIGNLVIFIDDLDRCPPNLVTEILEAISLFFDKGQCIFVLGMDIGKVANIIETYYQEYTLERTNEQDNNIFLKPFSGEEYLKKMVQIQFNLPKLDDKKFKEFIEKEICPELSGIYRSELIHNTLVGVNIRELKRFFNTSILLFEIKNSLKKNNQFNLDNELFVKWQLMQFFFPNLIHIIEKKHSILLALNEYARERNYEELLTKYEIKGEIVPIFKNSCDNTKLMSILNHGDTNYDKESINACLHWCNFSKFEIEKEGSVTITASGDGSYYFGEKIHFSGTNTASKKTYFSIKGPKLSKNGVNIEKPSLECIDNQKDTFSISNVRSDQTWEYFIETRHLFPTLTRGTYTVYSSSEPITNPENSNIKYDTITLVLKDPLIVAVAKESTVAIGDPYTIFGTAEGDPNKIVIWIIGDNYINNYDVGVNPDGSFEFNLKDPDMKQGQYFVIIQHPNVKDYFDVYLEERQIISKSGKSIDINDFNGSDLASELINLLNSQNCDDKYTKLSFLAEIPWINIQTEIRGDNKNYRNKNSQFIVQGFTNLKIGSIIHMNLSQIKEESGEITEIPYIQKDVEVSEGSTHNKWSVILDTSMLENGKYKISLIALGNIEPAYEEFELI